MAAQLANLAECASHSAKGLNKMIIVLNKPQRGKDQLGTVSLQQQQQHR